MSLKRFGVPSQVFDVSIENQDFARRAERFGLLDILLRSLSHD
jgi:hypothetical protein